MRPFSLRSVASCAAFGFVFSLGSVGCDESRANGDGGSKPLPGLDGGGTSGTSGDAAANNCVQTPTTPAEVLNRCPLPGTEQIDKQPSLPLLGAAGDLPPIP
jgi:hypothetical protein